MSIACIGCLLLITAALCWFIAAVDDCPLADCVHLACFTISCFAADDLFIATAVQAGQYLSYAKKISPGNMRLLLKASAYGMPLVNMAKQAKQFAQQHSLVVLAFLFLMLALLMRYLGWV